MKLTILIMTLFLMQVSAASKAQISINAKQESIRTVLKAISKQSGYDLVYINEDLDKANPVDLKLTNVSIEKALEAVFYKQPLVYEVSDKTVLIKKKEEKSYLETVIARFQAIDVRGKVVDSLGNGLAGATVSVKGTNKGTSTSANGDFYLKNVDESAVLLISYLGYITKESAINKEFNYIQLRQSTSKLDEIQVIAYGRTSQRLSTGNVTVVKAEEIGKQPVNNPLYALQGRVPGLQITPTTGLAGGAVNLQIRGKSSLNSGTEPLVVVDGLPVTNNITGLGHPGYNGAGGNQLSALSFINTNDIESISVLKDADATSIYGSRGANGVILITTKKGVVGNTRVNLDLKTGSSDVPRKVKLLNTSQYLELRRDVLKNDGIDLKEFPWNSEELAFVTGDVVFWDSNRYTDWQEVLIGKNAPQSNFQGSISGGSSSINYIISGNHSKESTVFDQQNSDQRSGASMTLTGTSGNQRLRTTLRAQYMYNKNTLPGIDFTEKALTLAPNAPNLFTSEGILNWEPLPSGRKSWNNPYSEKFKIYEAVVKNLTANGDINYQISKGLDVTLQFGFNDLKGNSLRSMDLIAARPPEEIDVSSTASADFHTTSSQSFTVEPQLKYNFSFGKSSINALIGGSYQSNALESQLTGASGAVSDELIRNMAAFSRIAVYNQSSEYKYTAIFGRVNYNWENKYIVNMTIRRDGSSRFGPGSQFGTFGSGGFAWILSEESFFKNINPTLSFAKLKASYGTSGNDRIGDYAYIEKYSAISSGVSQPYQGNIGFKTSGIFNPYYAWEVVKKFEAGVDLGFFNDRFLLKTSYFRNRSSNQLAPYPMPAIAGPGALIVNIPATIQNTGIEILVEADNIKGKSFSWSTNFNLSKQNNKLISYDEIENTPYYQNLVGEPFYGIIPRYKFSGVNSNTGEALFVKADGTITSDPYVENGFDRGAYIRVNANPVFDGGIGNTFKFRSFTLDVFLQFKKQRGINPVTSYINLLAQPNNVPEAFNNRWTKEGDISAIPKLHSFLYPEEYARQLNYFTSSTFVDVDASFVRLKNLAFSYDISEKWRSKLNLQALKLYLQGQNLLTFTKYQGLDPESGSVWSLPPLRTWVIGIKVSF